MLFACNMDTFGGRWCMGRALYSLLHYTQLRKEHYQENIEAIKKPFWYNCLYGIAWIKVKCLTVSFV